MALEEDLDALGVFTEPQRRRVYAHLQATGPSTVSELVAALELGRTLVAFHLGKLVESGFVDVLAPDGAPGRGRPAQRYGVSRREVVASVPDRHYDLLAGVLLDGVAGFRPGDTAHSSALRAARRRGAELGQRLGRELGRVGRARSTAARLARLSGLLSRLGYAPFQDDGELSVRNCPFDKFRAERTDQVCALNKALSDGYLEGLELDEHLQARLRPCPDSCCVVFAPTAR